MTSISVNGSQLSEFQKQALCDALGVPRFVFDQSTGILKVSGNGFSDIFAAQGNSVFRAAILSAINSGGNIAVLGDSTVAEWLNHSYGFGFSSALLGAMGHAGSKFAPHHNGVIPVVSGNNDVSQVWTRTAPGDIAHLDSPLGWCTAFTCTPPQMGDSVRIIHANSGGNWTYSIDGAAPVAPIISGALTPKITVVNGLAYGKHTITGTLTSGSNLHVIGAHTFNQGEPCVLNFGAGGAKSSDLYRPDYWYSGYSLIKSLGAKCCFIRCTTNDILQGVDPAVTVANNIGMADGLAAAGSLVCFLPFTPLQNYDAQQASLWAALKAASAGKAHVFADYGADWIGTFFQANSAGLMYDDRHYNAAGTAREGSALRAWLGL